MYKKYLLICCLCSLISCAEKRPEDILSKEKMQDILVDLALAEHSLLHLSPPTGAEKPIRAVELYAYVFKKNGIMLSNFRKSNRYYTEHARDYVEIVKSVVDSLKSLKSQIDQRAKTHEKGLKAREQYKENMLPCLFCEPPRVPLSPIQMEKH